MTMFLVAAEVEPLSFLKAVTLFVVDPPRSDCFFCQYVSFSKRFVPEAINFLCGVLFLAIKKSPVGKTGESALPKVLLLLLCASRKKSNNSLWVRDNSRKIFSLLV